METVRTTSTSVGGITIRHAGRCGDNRFIGMTRRGDGLLGGENLVADGALGTVGQAVGGAGGSVTLHHLRGVTQCGGVISHVAITADGAGIGGIAAVLAIRSGDHSIVDMSNLPHFATDVTIHVASIVVGVVTQRQGIPRAGQKHLAIRTAGIGAAAIGHAGGGNFLKLVYIGMGTSVFAPIKVIVIISGTHHGSGGQQQ